MNIEIERLVPRTLKCEVSEDLVESIRAKGILNPLLVRAIGEKYQIIDGQQRYGVARHLDLKAVPCTVIAITNEQLLEVALMRPVIKIKTDPIEYARQLQRMMKQHSLTIAQIAEKIGKSESWVQEKLQLLN